MACFCNCILVTVQLNSALKELLISDMCFTFLVRDVLENLLCQVGQDGCKGADNNVQSFCQHSLTWTTLRILCFFTIESARQQRELENIPVFMFLLKSHAFGTVRSLAQPTFLRKAQWATDRTICICSHRKGVYHRKGDLLHINLERESVLRNLSLQLSAFCSGSSVNSSIRAFFSSPHSSFTHVLATKDQYKPHPSYPMKQPLHIYTESVTP